MKPVSAPDSIRGSRPAWSPGVEARTRGKGSLKMAVATFKKKQGMHCTVCSAVIVLMIGLQQVSAAVDPIAVTSDVGSACIEGIPRVCPQTIVTFTCTTATGALIWQTTNTTGSAGFTSAVDGIGAMIDLGVFTAEVIDEQGVSLTSTLTVEAANASPEGETVTCLDNAVGGNEQSTNVPLFVQATPTGQEMPMVNTVSNSLDCSAGTENVTVTWNCPANTGGTAITSFSVSVNDADPQIYVGTVMTSGPIPLNVTVEHTISVTASNCMGAGESAVTMWPSQARAPSAPELLAASLNCQSTLDTITVTWAEPDTNLRCPVTSRTVSAVNSTDSLSCTDTQSPSICSGSIAGATYNVTVAVASDLSVSQNSPSTQSLQVTVQRFIVDTTLLPNNRIEVKLDERCDGDPARYGVAVIQDGSSPDITRFLSNPIFVTINAGQPFSVRFYYDEMVLEETEELIAGCSREGLTANNVVVSPDEDSYGNGAVITLGCSSGTFSGPPSRTCVMGLWNPPLSEEAACSESDNTGAIVGGVVGGIGGVLLVLVIIVVVYLCYQKNKNKGSRKPSDVRELRERTRSDDGQPDVEIAAVGETAPMYADPSAIDRQEFPGTHDVYTVVDKTKKTHKPEDHQPTYQTPDDIKRQPAPATGEVYTIPEPKKGSKKKKEAMPPQKSDEELQQMYSQVDMGKKHQPPSGLVYSDISLPPSGKPPPSKSVDYTDIQPH